MLRRCKSLTATAKPQARKMGLPKLGAVVLLAHILILFAGTQGAYAPLESSSFKDLKAKVDEKLYPALLAEVNAAKEKVISIKSEFNTCQLDIDATLTECFSCEAQICEQKIASQCSATGVTGTNTDKFRLLKTLQCIIYPKACIIKLAQEKAVKVIQKVTDAAKNAIEKVGKAAKKVGKAVEEAAKKAKKAAKKIPEGAKKVVKGVGKVVKKAGEAIKKGVKKVIDGTKKVVKKVEEGVKKVVKKVIAPVKNVVRRIRIRFRFGRRRRRRRRWGRRRREVEPSCDQLLNDDKACSYYQKDCSSCAVVETATGEDIITEVCGQTVLDNFNNLNNFIQRVEDLAAFIDTFNLTGILWDPNAFAGTGFPFRVQYTLQNQKREFQVSKPVHVHSGAPVILQDILDLLVPKAV